MSEKLIPLVEDDEGLAVPAFGRSRIADEMVVVRVGQEALDSLPRTVDHAGRDAEVLPQVVLLDPRVQKVGGLEILGGQRLQVAVPTSSREGQDLLEGYDCGANSYVRKPVGLRCFAEAIRHEMYWLVLDDSPTTR